ncbi:unnamed protein product [Camellia sinensis]
MSGLRATSSYKESDGNKVHISKQRGPSLSDDLIKNGKHFILIRNPLSILPSFDKVVPPSFLELGLGDLVSIYNNLWESPQQSLMHQNFKKIPRPVKMPLKLLQIYKDKKFSHG